MQLTLHTGDDEDDNSCEKSSLKSLCLKLMGMGIFHISLLNCGMVKGRVQMLMVLLSNLQANLLRDSLRGKHS